MLRKTPMLVAGILLVTAACSGVDSAGNGIDATDITASAYRLTSGQTLHVSPENATVAVGATIKLSTVVSSSTGQTLSANGNLSAKWMSSDTTIARVSGSGNVVGVRNGVATITATASGQTSAANVTVGTGASTSTTTPSTTTPSTTTTTEPVTGSSTTSGTTTTTTTSGTTTTTTSTPAPTGSTQPQTSFQNAVVYDDFTRYHSTADLQANISTNIGGTGSPATALYTDGHNPQLASFDPNMTYNGHPTVRYDQPAGSGLTPQLWVNFPNSKTVTNLWYRVVVRFSPGWTTTGTIVNSANSYKLFDWGWAGGWAGRGGIVLTNTTQYQAYFYLLNGGSEITAPNDTPFANVQNEWTDGQWYTYIINYQQTGPSTAVERVWMGKQGQTPVLLATVQGNGNGNTWPAINRIEVGENFNQTRVNAQALWIGEWSAFDGNQYTNPYNVQ